MSCEYCNYLNGHSNRCPNYTEHISRYRCTYCNDLIRAGEEYVRNDNGEYIHKECIFDVDSIVKWLGYKIERMEGNGEGR